MLVLKDIKKNYEVGDGVVEALNGVNVAFRESEFVSILGPSGCGKTTLLNIIGGLDRYSSGEMMINGVPTVDYKDADWDSYRNHSIGFVFQSYNLIPHQSVLSNVELALTISGVSKQERRKRAINVLERVGLADQIHKKPNQLSGGQMQRVSIARALVNDPDILLADEPTGALDSNTSIQVMELMREIANDRLVIMVTHNPDIASKYSTRIIKLLDGRITDDTNPYVPESIIAKPVVKKHISMGFITALMLSLNNLMTKKTRTALTSFAGSIGIIGIALILSLSNGIQQYINRVEEETLSSYPLTIERQTVDMSAMLSTMMGVSMSDREREDGKIYSSNVMGDMINSMTSQITNNDTKAFKSFLENNSDEVDKLVSDIMYSYSTELNIYGTDVSGNSIQVSPTTIFEKIGLTGEIGSMYSSGASMSIWTELMGNSDLLNSQYDVIAGRMPENYNEVVLFVNKDNTISDIVLYSLGLKDQSEMAGMFAEAMSGGGVDTTTIEFTYNDLLALRYKLVVNTDYYKNTDGVWKDMRGDSEFMDELLANSTEIKVVGILRASDEAINASTNGAIGYTHALSEYVINGINSSEIVKQQKENPDIDVFTGLSFTAATQEMDTSSLNAEQLEYFNSLSDEEKAALMESYAKDTVVSTNTYEGNLTALGVSDINTPDYILIYPKDFSAKAALSDMIDSYNADNPDSEIQYTDYVEIIMSSVNTIVDAISYVLIAFVAISLVVSSLMIGIITYISVLERTKEIGILRSIGASKRDISRVFNAETLIVGFSAGMFGILISLLLTIPINIIIKHLADISNVAQLPPLGAVILVAISMVLTFIAGLIPSKIAARRDPVVALRTE